MVPGSSIILIHTTPLYQYIMIDFHFQETRKNIQTENRQEEQGLHIVLYHLNT